MGPSALLAREEGSVLLEPGYGMCSTYYYAMPRYINDIIIHCSDSPWRRDDKAKDIKAWHTAAPPLGRGWADIGYHYVIDLDGTVERGRVISRAGAHCYGHNAHSIGICYVGGRDADGRTADTRTEAQKASMLKLVTNLTAMYGCATHGHHDYDHGKDCPCFDAYAEYKNIRAQLLERRVYGQSNRS